VSSVGHDGFVDEFCQRLAVAALDWVGLDFLGLGWRVSQEGFIVEIVVVIIRVVIFGILLGAFLRDGRLGFGRCLRLGGGGLLRYCFGLGGLLCGLGLGFLNTSVIRKWLRGVYNSL
jgi:hypothetical protein